MSANAETNPAATGQQEGQTQRRPSATDIALIIIAVAYGIYWFWYCVIMKKPMTLTWQGTVQIMAQVSGSDESLGRQHRFRAAAIRWSL